MIDEEKEESMVEDGIPTSQSTPKQQQTPMTPSYSGGKSEGPLNILALLSLIFAFIFPILGLILGIVALVKIKNDPSLTGKGMAVAGVIVGGIFSILPILLFALIIPAYFGILEPDSFLPNRCMFTTGLVCEDFVYEKNTLSLRLNNGLGSDIQLSELSFITQDNSVTCQKSLGGDFKKGENVLAAGSAKNVLLDCQGTSKDKVLSGDLNLKYLDLQTRFTHEVKGTLRYNIQ